VAKRCAVVQDGANDALAINGRRQVTGWSETASATNHAVLWEGDDTIDLGTLGGRNSGALAINESGHIVGSSSTALGRRPRLLGRRPRLSVATRHDDRSRDVGWQFPLATGINARGQVAGWSTTASAKLRAVLWQHGTINVSRRYRPPTRRKRGSGPRSATIRRSVTYGNRARHHCFRRPRVTSADGANH
jgi:probable HAF family extracellular repeat protein